jgi:hypothetical protein
MGLAKIISGGQTGIDRGALDAAFTWGFPCGGWCSPGRLAEDSRIPEGGYRQRTLRDILESDRTAILYFSLYLNQELAYQGGHHIAWRHCPDTQWNIARNDSRRLFNGPYHHLPVPDF